MPDSDASAGRTVEPRALSDELDRPFTQRVVPSQPPVLAVPSADARVLLAVRDVEVRELIAPSARRRRASTVVETDDGDKALDADPRATAARAGARTVLSVGARPRHLPAAARDARATPTLPIVVLPMPSAAGAWRATCDDNYGIKHFFEKPFDAPKLDRAPCGCCSTASRAADELAAAVRRGARRKWNAGMKAFERGDLDAAIAQLKAASQIDPQAFELQYHLGLLYGRRDDLFRAIRDAGDRPCACSRGTFPRSRTSRWCISEQVSGTKRIDAWERAMTACARR